MTFCESYSAGCECRFYDSESGKYLGFCRNNEFHPLSEPFDITKCRVDKGPFRHQEGRVRK